MTNTAVFLLDEDGVFVPSVGSIPVVSGDTISIATSNGVAAFAWFSPAAAAILSPTPANPFPIPARDKAVFTFKSSQPGAYSAYFGHDKDDAPSSFPTGTSGALLLEVNTSDEPTFGGPGDTVGTGHGG